MSQFATCLDCKDEKRVKGQLYAKCAYHRKKYHIDWRRGNPEKALAASRRYHAKLKSEVMHFYGGMPPKCACCKEDNMIFLTIDHIQGGGVKHVKQIGKSFYSWLRSNKYPDGFRVLCFNCNSGRSVNKGICPHETTQS